MAPIVVPKIVQPQCQIFDISEDQRCVREATADKNLFGRFNAKHRYGMYTGYTRRDAELDAMALHEVHGFLFGKCVLLDKVIATRTVDYKHFLDLDYGHKTSLDKLANTHICEGVKKDFSHVNGPMIVGTPNNHIELANRTAPVEDKVEKPSLQALRDACADFVRGDEADGKYEQQPDDTVELCPMADYIRT
ncbi:hypothetical protein VTI74DRAFT_653 [Chaetomium olivicolor]